MKKGQDKKLVALIYAAFIAGLCSIIYELLIATTISYFLGDSVKYFSVTIGVYMASMGLGSYVSKYVDAGVLRRFIQAELLLGICGGLSIPVLYFFYPYRATFLFVYLLFTFIIGFLIGLEIPFLTRLMEKYKELKFNVANILSFDYLGALIATVSFPFILLPFFGVYQSSLIFGLVNMSIAFVIIRFFADDGEVNKKAYKFVTYSLSILLVGMICSSKIFLSHWDKTLYKDRIVFNKQTIYQKIVLTKFKNDLRLFLNRNLQFSSLDEYRYHESLVHVPLSVHKKPVRRVLLLGAGDGLAVRELLKYDFIEEIILVDLDKEVINLAKENPYLSSLNQRSLFSERVKIIFSDAYSFLSKNSDSFDLIIADLPDPNREVLARLYSKQFYEVVRNNLNEDGLFVTQSTSPYFARKAFWSINKTLKAAGFDYVYPFYVEMLTFGIWGFEIATKYPQDIDNPSVIVETQYISDETIGKMFVFEKDTGEESAEVNTIDRPILLNYYLQGWKKYAR